MKALLDYIFGCKHTRHTWPIKPIKDEPAHICCLDCGKRLEYSWREMKIGKEVAR